MTSYLPAAVLWDMDGTLVDTEPYWMNAETELLRTFGRDWSGDEAEALIGCGLWDGARILQGHGVGLSEDEIVHRLTERVRTHLAEDGVPWQPGAQELLRELKARNIPTALVTMSVQSMAADIAAAAGFAAFDVMVTGDTVDNPKPHPEPYLKAAELLGLDIRDCVAVEDSPTGLASAIAAETIAVGVPHILPLPPGPHHSVWTSLAGKTVADFTELARERRAARSAQ